MAKMPEEDISSQTKNMGEAATVVLLQRILSKRWVGAAWSWVHHHEGPLAEGLKFQQKTAEGGDKRSEMLPSGRDTRFHLTASSVMVNEAEPKRGSRDYSRTDNTFGTF